MNRRLTANIPSEDEYQFWYQRSLKHYAEDKMKANGLTQAEADALSKSSFERLLPQKYETPDQHFRVLKTADGALAGYYWFAAIGSQEKRKAFIYDIIIEESHRSQGYGREAMQMIEEHARSLDLVQIALHVFAFNKTAVNLYQSLGYETTDLVMEKPLK